MKRVVLLISSVCLIIITMSSSFVNASTLTNEKRALKSYRKFLKKDKYSVNDTNYKTCHSQFIVKDLNNDKIKELIMLPNLDEMCTYIVYTYTKGKVKLIESAGHSEIGYFNKRKIYVSEWISNGVIARYYQTIKNGKLKTIAIYNDYQFFDEPMDDNYYVKNKQVTKRKFLRCLKKYNIKKPLKYKTFSEKQKHKVTSENIKKYVK